MTRSLALVAPHDIRRSKPRLARFEAVHEQLHQELRNELEALRDRRLTASLAAHLDYELAGDPELIGWGR